MTDSGWLRQSKDKPLFEDLLWSRPETKARAGKLLIIGGSANGFKAPATAFNYAISAGAGEIKVLLPDSLRKNVGKYIEDAVYLPSNISGGLSRQSLAELLDYCSWADATLLAGDLGHNSETSILLESFVKEYAGPLTLTGDSLNQFLAIPLNIFDRPNTLISCDLAMLQKMVAKLSFPRAITSSLDLIQMVELLKELSDKHRAGIITEHTGNVIVALNGQVSFTKTESISDWDLKSATYASVWWLQNSVRAFEAITTSIFDTFSKE